MLFPTNLLKSSYGAIVWGRCNLMLQKDKNSYPQYYDKFSTFCNRRKLLMLL